MPDKGSRRAHEALRTVLDGDFPLKWGNDPCSPLGGRNQTDRTYSVLNRKFFTKKPAKAGIGPSYRRFQPFLRLLNPSPASASPTRAIEAGSGTVVDAPAIVKL